MAIDTTKTHDDGEVERIALPVYEIEVETLMSAVDLINVLCVHLGFPDILVVLHSIHIVYKHKDQENKPDRLIDVVLSTSMVELDGEMVTSHEILVSRSNINTTEAEPKVNTVTQLQLSTTESFDLVSAIAAIGKNVAWLNGEADGQ